MPKLKDYKEVYQIWVDSLGNFTGRLDDRLIVEPKPTIKEVEKALDRISKASIKRLPVIVSRGQSSMLRGNITSIGEPRGSNRAKSLMPRVTYMEKFGRYGYPKGEYQTHELFHFGRVFPETVENLKLYAKWAKLTADIEGLQEQVKDTVARLSDPVTLEGVTK